LHNTELQNMLNGIAIKLGILGLLMFGFSGVMALILKPLPIFKELKQILISIASLLGFYIWYKIHF